MQAAPSALVVLAQGSEEMEVVILVDVLRRGGVAVTVAGLGPDLVHECGRGIRIVAECLLSACVPHFDLIVLPGGMPGSRSMAACADLGRRLRAQHEHGLAIAAICAAPIALRAHGVGAGHSMTSHPSVRTELEGFCDWVDAPVVTSGGITTSQGPGTAFEFALALVAGLVGADRADALRAPMILPSEILPPGIWPPGRE